MGVSASTTGRELSTRGAATVSCVGGLGSRVGVKVGVGVIVGAGVILVAMLLERFWGVGMGVGVTNGVSLLGSDVAVGLMGVRRSGAIDG